MALREPAYLDPGPAYGSYASAADPVPSREAVKAWLDEARANFVAGLRNSYVANEFDLHFQIDFDQISDCLHDNLSDAITHDDWSKLL